MRYLVFFGLVLLQSMSFTFVSRARNQSNLMVAWIASIFSNGIWLLVFRKLVMNFSDILICVLYVVAMTVGTVVQMVISIKYIEKNNGKR